MTDIDRLLAAILANPADDAARLVYADKIEERDRPGDAERANLIRVGGDYTFTVTDNGLLFSEGEPIDAPMLSAWYGVFDQLGSDSWPANVSVSVSRGFIAEVRGPEAALVGGECGRCAGTGIYTDDEMVCSACKGDGNFSAVLPAIAQAHPLEWVEATDRRPWRDGYTRKFVWWRVSAWSDRGVNSHGNIPDFLFDIIASAHPKNVLNTDGPPSFEHIAFATEHAALAAHSRALIAWARKEKTCTT